MKFFQTAFVRLSFLFAAVLLFSSFPVFAQEGEPVVIDEVVAQVNDGVITLSRVKREMRNAAQAKVQAEGKTPEDATREVESQRSEFIAGLINEELIMQQGKELGLERTIEEEVNARFVQIMKQQNIKSLDELYKQMRSENVDPEDIKAMWRKQVVPEMVFNQDVDGKIYNGFTMPELRDYFEKHKDKFLKTETVTLSEIFLTLAGRDETAVKAKAADLVKQLRGGANFETLVEANSEREGTKKNKGKINTFTISDLQNQEPTVVAAIKNVKAGGFSDPVQVDEGVIIFRVDERVAGGSAPVFEERRVREAMLLERRPAERKKYLTNLRQEAYIKISASYRAAVEPLLSKDETKN